MSTEANDRFERRAADELRAIADRAPEIADDLRQMAENLETEARRRGTRSPNLSFGRLFRRLKT